MAEIEFKSVAKSFDKVGVIAGLDLRVQDGEFIVFVGPSGCGKSTALRMIAGLEETTAGDIQIGGRSVTGLAPSDRNVAMVFQSYALYPHMTVAGNIGFPLKMAGRPAAEIALRVKEAADVLDLGPYLGRRPAQLSGGQRQRVALGRAIVRHPDVFLFDEPLSNLDADLRVSMRGEIMRLRERIRATMIYVTHDQTEAMTMGDRIAVFAPLKDGHGRNLMQVGRPEELYERPANLFVARFLGSPKMNLIEVGEGEMLPFGTMDLGPRPDGHHGALLLGVRPEDIRIAGAGTPGLAGRIRLVEALGAEYYVHVETEAGELIVRVMDKRLRPVSGEAVALQPASTAFHLFDKATGSRVGG
ncbi:sugar ABC transporter ATP-binding protein [Pleomorphomonas diazotrophica]|uniref:Sugar ABC transporter ATP-binding protein n=1 Tax=Pleomorphomonas diazotrophica TaxID=1166257 RepID=A0A1I4RPV0_9HYPH|nr:ATP-binding cassette domain-containing protein [Pleomorphomonas diazotrophica]PKR88133.1 sugar ABC transporter ATP-binding protein [Pleomorphomonas diazotrophica]SFM54214.1 multiple sugar transport system ATP-binding protein/multiple sugar transport system ATP-binding protein [Pleomorphomonas diazotrophica]